jgi:hypothetical protein
MYEKKIKHLEDAHQQLNKRIDGLEKTGVFDDVEIADLKKKKLYVKDLILELKKREHDEKAI